MNLIDGLLIAAILLVLCALVGPAIFARPKRVRSQDELDLAREAAKAADAAKKLFGEQVGLTFALLLLSERIERMGRHAHSLPVPGDDPLSDLGREKRIIIEQIRIASAHCREIKVAMADFDSSTLETVRWPFTAADLQLSFAKKRLERWPPNTDTTTKEV